MRVEYRSKLQTEEKKVLGENLSQCTRAPQIPHGMVSDEPGPPWREVGGD